MGNHRSLHLKEISIRTVLQSQHSDVTELLRSHGWKSLGQGAEAIVALHPQKLYVLKLFPKNSRYKNFVGFCLRRSLNPHLPRFGRSSRTIPGTEWMYVRMELLQPVSKTALLNDFLPHLCYLEHKTYLANISWFNQLQKDVRLAVAGQLKQNPSWLAKISKTLGVTSSQDISEKTIDRETARMGNSAPTSWKLTVDQLVDYMDNADYGLLDMHSDNFMMRGSELVILDPWV